MAQVNIYEAKTHLSRLLRRVKSGEEIIIAEAGRAVAKLVPIERSGQRTLGGDEGLVWIADDFDAPLPDAILDSFYDGDLPRTKPAAKPKPRSKARAKIKTTTKTTTKTRTRSPKRKAQRKVRGS